MLLQLWRQQLGSSRISAAPAVGLALAGTGMAAVPASMDVLAVAGTGMAAVPASMAGAVPADGSAEAAAGGEVQQPAAAAAAAAASKIEVHQQQHVVVCSSDGAVDVLTVQDGAFGMEADLLSSDSGVATEGVAPQAVTTTAQTLLPGEVFSSPVFLDEWLLLGCRDDHLYCLRVA